MDRQAHLLKNIASISKKTLLKFVFVNLLGYICPDLGG